MMMQYRGIPLGELSPHAYAIAEQVCLGFPAIALIQLSCLVIAFTFPAIMMSSWQD
jgi:hypothetical protein